MAIVWPSSAAAAGELVLRAEAETALKQRAGPHGTPDLVMIVIISTVYAIDLAAAGFALYNRGYPPLKCKSPIIMAAVVVCSILWFVGDIQANGLVPLAGTVLVNCRAFGLWVRILLGVGTVSMLIALRTYGLHRVFRQGLPFRGWGLYLPLLVYTVAMIVFGTVLQLLPAEKTMFYVADVDRCRGTWPVKISIFAFLWVTWVAVAVLSWRIRRIKSSFNESRESVIACLAVMVMLVFLSVLHYTKVLSPMRAVFRVLATSIDHLVINAFWWAIMGVPLFNCMFRREKYLDAWLDKLCGDGLHHQYDVPSPEASKLSTSIRRARTSLLAPVQTCRLLNDADPLQLPLDAGFPLFDPALEHPRPYSADSKNHDRLQTPVTLTYSLDDTSDLLYPPVARTPAESHPSRPTFW
ncbi:hypothetical protein H4R19_000417 [Coemansia spiralis]|nr:hypothetical protein H4R19_000417 [Coemansia spiralis]